MCIRDSCGRESAPWRDDPHEADNAMDTDRRVAASAQRQGSELRRSPECTATASATMPRSLRRGLCD
eukprot:1311816-Alexandrium_andersonii.AAC.1